VIAAQETMMQLPNRATARRSFHGRNHHSSRFLPWLLLITMLALHGGLGLGMATAVAQSALSYDIVYVRAPRYGDIVNTKWPEVINPVQMEPGADLMLLHPDGSEEVLFAAGPGAVVDPVPSFDAKWVYFSYFPDVRTPALNYQRNNAPKLGADIYKINVATRKLLRLTQQKWEPPSGAANWSSDHLSASAPDKTYLGYGIFNLSPCPLPDGKLMFVSSRDGYLPNKGMTFPNLRLYIMDDNGQNVEAVGHLNMGSALHPTVLKDGRVMFSSYESQGARDDRVWSLWALWPDGQKWEPLMSPFKIGAAFHFQTQLSDGRIGVLEYYNLNNSGFGTLLAFNATKPAGNAPFGSAIASDASNPLVRRGIWNFDPGHPQYQQPRFTQYAFSPPGLVALTGFTHGEDQAAGLEPDGTWAGKVTHPSAAPHNDVLLVWSPGPVNHLNRPTYLPRPDGGIYLLRGGQALTDHRQLLLVKNDPRYNEMQPRALVPYAAIHGVSAPASLPFLPNDGRLHSALPAGTPHALVGASSFYKRDTAPGSGSSHPSYNGLDVFNTAENDSSSNWFIQGADAGRYSSADIHAVRILGMEAVAHRSYGPGATGGSPGFRSHAGAERLRVLGEIQLRKAPAVIDPDGNPDTSFLALLPADTPFSFQTLDKDGLVLNMAQTWHMLRPGEVRTNCGGCHAHSQVPTDFANTAAGQPGFQPSDLTANTPLLTKNSKGQTVTATASRHAVDVEFNRDIRPILQRSCVMCHSSTGRQEASLALDDTSLIDGFDATYVRLARDAEARFGIKPVISNGSWRQTNSSRYVRIFQARRSLLMWKIMGRRLDGWSNADHPTESVPGNPATLPAGANANLADIDFKGTIMPPPGAGVPALSEDEKMTFARWIDLGAQVDSPDPQLKTMGLFADDIKPVLTVSAPRAGISKLALTQLRIGFYDNYSGIDRQSLSVKASVAINGKPAGAELGGEFTGVGNGVWTLAVNPPLAGVRSARLTVKVKDLAGNESVVERVFGSSGEPPAAGR
jgi:Hydrazine synthase alpha subunit middle domain